MSSSDDRIVVVTGASGLLGSHLSRFLANRGWKVRALLRRPEFPPESLVHPNIELAHCDLPEVIPRDSLSGATHLIHCAYATQALTSSQAERVNEVGTRALLQASRRFGIDKFIFISSLSAAADAPSYYARSKHLLERELDESRDLAIRPGLILAAGGGKGLISRLVESMRTLRVVPLFDGGQQPLQTVHIEDLCGAVDRALDRDLCGILSVAEPRPVSMRHFFEIVAERLEIRCLFVPVPFSPVLAILKTMEAARLPLPLRSENLLGLKALRAAPVVEDLARLDLQVRPVSESLADLFPSPSR